jgi:hypothetical protein
MTKKGSVGQNFSLSRRNRRPIIGILWLKHITIEQGKNRVEGILQHTMGLVRGNLFFGL